MKPELKKLLLLNLPYLLFVYLFVKCGQAYRLAAGADASAKLLHLTSGISAAFANPLPSLHPFDLCVGVVGAVAVRLIVYSKGKNTKKYRKGEEYGSARWGTAKDIAPYIDPKFENNILLTQTERLTMTGRPKDPKTARNKNVLVIGGSGSGKTRFYVKPNLMQCFPTSDYPTSFVVTDPKGTLVLETGQMFQRAGYRVKILNTINFSKSMKYNPFVYIHSEKDVLKLVNTLIANTKGEGEKSAEDFWVKSERLFYTALIGYIWYEAPAEEMNFTTLLEMINASEAREDDPDFQSPVDLMFERLEQKDPDHFAVRQYKKFLLSAGKTRSSILIKNPTDDVTLPKKVTAAKTILNDKQLERFMEAIKADEHWHDFFYLEITTGLRRGELCGLMWTDFDAEKGTLTVRRTLHNKEGGGYYVGETKTGAGRRIIKLPPSTVQLLSERKRTSISQWIFPNPIHPEDPIMPNSGYTRMKKLLAEAGLPNMRFHDLRHTFATHALTSGVDAKTLSGILGHTKTSFTLDTYTHVTGDMHRKASGIVGEFMSDFVVKG